MTKTATFTVIPGRGAHSSFRLIIETHPEPKTWCTRCIWTEALPGSTYCQRCRCQADIDDGYECRRCSKPAYRDLGLCWWHFR